MLDGPSSPFILDVISGFEAREGFESNRCELPTSRRSLICGTLAP